MKTLHCRDVGFNCAHIIQAETDDELLAQAAKHAAEVHHFTVTDKVEGQIRTMIRDGSNNASGK